MQYNNQSKFNTLPRIILLILLIVMLSACGAMSSVHQTTTLQIKNASQTGTVISGYIIESDGATPVYGATVAVLANELSIQSTASKETCTSPSKPHVNFTCSNEDGSFSLDLAQARKFPVTISIEKLDEIQEITLSLNDLNSDIGMVTLAPEVVEHKEKVAVVMDFYNPLDDIQSFLNANPSQTREVKLQLMNEYQNLFKIDSADSDITYPTFFSLFNDADEDGKPDIFNYDVVYINSRQQSDIALLDQSIRAELLNFMTNGGNLFITEWTVELEQEEPSVDQYI